MKGQDAALHALIEGRVQGVGFRYFVLEQAEKLSLTGWVRNQEGGDVEVYAEGQREKLELLLTHLERGPRAAFVSNITVEWLEASGKFNRFNIATTDW